MLFRSDPRPDPLPTKAPSSHVSPEAVGGREGGAKVKAGPTGLAPLRGSWGRGGFPKPRGAHSQQGNQQGWGETFEVLEVQRRMGKTFPPSAGVPGLNLRPLRPPLTMLSLSPTPATPREPLPAALVLSLGLTPCLSPADLSPAHT